MDFLLTASLAHGLGAVSQSVSLLVSCLEQSPRGFVLVVFFFFFFLENLGGKVVVICWPCDREVFQKCNMSLWGLLLGVFLGSVYFLYSTYVQLLISCNLPIMYLSCDWLQVSIVVLTFMLRSTVLHLNAALRRWGNITYYSEQCYGHPLE